MFVHLLYSELEWARFATFRQGYQSRLLVAASDLWRSDSRLRRHHLIHIVDHFDEQRPPGEQKKCATPLGMGGLLANRCQGPWSPPFSGTPYKRAQLSTFKRDDIHGSSWISISNMPCKRSRSSLVDLSLGHFHAPSK